MNLARLRRLNATLQEAARTLDAELAAPEAARDPLALHIYEARRSYRTTRENDGKGGRDTRIFLILSLQKAREHGYPGGADEWQRLMRAG